MSCRSHAFFTLPATAASDDISTSSFIMFEFGLEKINLNLARRFGFSEEKKEPEMKAFNASIHSSLSKGGVLN